MLFTGIEHFAMAARDPKALAEWYERVLGFRTRITFDNGAEKPKTYFIQLGEQGPCVEIIPADLSKELREKANSDPGLSHVAILVSDFDKATQALENLQVKKEGPERQAPYGGRVQFYRDPDGNLFHTLFRPQPLPLN